MKARSDNLRSGFTTGACAAAAAAAAYAGWTGGRFPDPVTIRFPDGKDHAFPLIRSSSSGQGALASVLKDAGDDPDVTHEAEVIAEVRAGRPGGGVVFHGGEGVGTVTKPGLPLAVGEPAINDGPRAMIRAALRAAMAGPNGLDSGGAADPDIEVTISIPGGEALAEKTLNRRLGIVGGLSILGSSGRVTPYSCSAWIHSIHRGVDVARAAGHDHIAAATGKVSERAVRALTGLPEEAVIDMGDFAGGLLKYLRKRPVAHLSLAGGFAKLAKLADGAMDLHSSRSRVDTGRLAARLIDLGGDVAAAGAASSAGELLAQAGAAGLPLADTVAARARTAALAVLAGATKVDIYIVDRQGRVAGRAA